MKTKQPRKQRKRMKFIALRKGVHAHLSKELREKYGFRSFGLRKGDTVKVMRGKFKGKVGKVESIDLKKQKVFVEGVEIQKADGTKAKVGVHPSNLLITAFDLSDKLRKEKLQMKGEAK